MRLVLFLFSFFSFILVGCHSDSTSEPPRVLTSQQLLQENIAELKHTAHTGDLLTRLTDDIISPYVSQMNNQDKTYSHCGMVVEKQGAKYVYHISPNESGKDTIEMTPIDTFINPQTTLKCALFRYTISPEEKTALITQIEGYKAKGVRFDAVYDLSTDDKMYCSEMIAKALATATKGRVACEAVPVPKRMYKLLQVFFKKYAGAEKLIAQRKYIPLDNLYLRPDCQELMKFNLKTFPGQQ